MQTFCVTVKLKNQPHDVEISDLSHDLVQDVISGLNFRNVSSLKIEVEK